MHQIKIIVTPIPEKRLELFQTLESLKVFFQPHCNDISIIETKKAITIAGTIEDVKQLHGLVESNEFEVLNGAIAILSVNSEIRIRNAKDEQPMNYLKRIITNHKDVKYEV